MSLNPIIENMLEAYQPEQLHSLLAWLDPALQNLTDIESPNTKAESNMSTSITTPISNGLQLEDQVALSILSEFGPNFSTKPYFQWLNNNVSQRIIAPTQA